jgi:hypothetical protein
MAADLLARVPADLDALNQDVVVTACTRLGFNVEHTRGRRVFAIELGSGALVDSLPGVRSGSAYVGSFDREEAVEDETIDFFASGHRSSRDPGALRRRSVSAARCASSCTRAAKPARGWLAVYKDGPDFEGGGVRRPPGRARPEWAAALRERPRRVRARGRPCAGPQGLDRNGTPAWRQAGSVANAARTRGARRPASLNTTSRLYTPPRRCPRRLPPLQPAPASRRSTSSAAS